MASIADISLHIIGEQIVGIVLVVFTLGVACRMQFVGQLQGPALMLWNAPDTTTSEV